MLKELVKIGELIEAQMNFLNSCVLIKMLLHKLNQIFNLLKKISYVMTGYEYDNNNA